MSLIARMHVVRVILRCVCIAACGNAAVIDAPRGSRVGLQGLCAYNHQGALRTLFCAVPFAQAILLCRTCTLEACCKLCCVLYVTLQAALLELVQVLEAGQDELFDENDEEADDESVNHDSSDDADEEKDDDDDKNEDDDMEEEAEAEAEAEAPCVHSFCAHRVFCRDDDGTAAHGSARPTPTPTPTPSPAATRSC